MARIGLTSGFSLIPEGTHIFKITEVDYKETYGKLEIKMVTASGQKHTERFALIGKDKKPNEKAYNAFSYFAKTALNDFDRTEIDHTELIGCYIEAVVEHDTQPSTTKPGETITFARLTDKYPASGFDAVPVKQGAAQAPASAETLDPASINLDELLG